LAQRIAADGLQPKVPKLTHLRNEAGVLAEMTVPKEHRAKLPNTDPIECLNSEIQRRTEVA
jgi:putative transposase